MPEEQSSVPQSAEEAGALKARLVVDPHDESARHGLITWYRRNGHLDQAGRYAIAVTGMATDGELRAYVAMLRGLGADEDRMRTLSRLPAGYEIEPRAREALEAKPPKQTILGTATGVAWTVFAVAVLVMLIGSFAVTVSGSTDAHESALMMSVLTLLVLAVASVLSAILFAIERGRIATVVFALIGSGALAFALLLIPG